MALKFAGKGAVVVLAQKTAACHLRAAHGQPARHVDALAADVLLLGDILEDLATPLRRTWKARRGVDGGAHAQAEEHG